MIKPLPVLIPSDEQRMQDIIAAVPGVVYQYVFRAGGRGGFTFVSSGVKDLIGFTPEEIYRDSGLITACVHPEDLRRLTGLALSAVQRLGNWSFELRLILPGVGEKKVLSSVRPKHLPGGAIVWNGVLMEMTGGKTAEDELIRLGTHDQLTGLYNRSYFETQLAGNCRFPKATAVVIWDIDGLKLINDTFGYAEGNKLLEASAQIIGASLKDGDLAARIGDDEFVALLPAAGEQEAEKKAHAIREAIVNYGLTKFHIPFSVAVGFAVSCEDACPLTDVFKAADDSMGREKLHHAGSKRSKIIQALAAALEARDYITDGHASRLQGMALMLAMAVGLPENRFGDLRLLALFHDLGKVAIPDDILFKPEMLTAEEQAIMRRHCEIGHRVAQGLPDLRPIADWILKHHEWWNGGGYPLGLAGEEIPLECRIISIVDAYDAMINDRPYRAALSHRQAIAEIRRNSGSQFDATLADRFVSLMEGQNLQ
ncbi:MAG: diguanylate cyclase [Negativicutes bacterium]|nr:diguanylate cyclase [Negativicutes bacterium]